MQIHIDFCYFKTKLILTNFYIHLFCSKENTRVGKIKIVHLSCKPNYLKTLYLCQQKLYIY